MKKRIVPFVLALLGPCAPLLAAPAAPVAAPAPAPAPASASAPATMQARLLACAACHGVHGEGTANDYFPRLAGKPADYLFDQLVAFRDGGRSYPPMNYLLAYLPDAYLRQIAEHISRERPPYPPPATPTVDAATLARGKELVTQGDPAHDVPACAACHGHALTGMEPAIPGLVGLHANYISAQLGAFRYGTRRTAPPNCMHDIATRLADRDITAVAAWLAAQPAPADPAPAAAAPLPLACGSAAETTAPPTAPATALTALTAAAPHAPTELIATGEYLARAGDCIACHTKPGGKPFAGGRAMETPFGTLFTPNISSDRETGIGNWTAAQFYRMMHEGRSYDGTLLYPAMPFAAYTKVTRADSDALYAFLMSTAPVHQPNRPHELRFPYNERSLLLGWRTLYFRPGQFQPDPRHSVEWNRGAYLVEGLGHCSMCHTTMNALGGSQQSKAFQGGLIPMQNWYAPSLTSNAEAGLGDWSIEDIVALLRTGVSPRGAVYGPMAEVVNQSLQYLSDEDVRAMAVYLKSLPGHANEGDRSPPGKYAAEEAGRLAPLGEKIYAAQCAVCHAADGRGKPPAFPPLAANPSIQMRSAVNPIRMVLNGGYPPATKLNPQPYGMPPFAQSLSDREIAAVVTYIRTAWGNRGTPVSEREVNDLRSAPLF